MLVYGWAGGEGGLGGVQGGVCELADVRLDCLVEGLVLVSVGRGLVSQDFLGEGCDLRVGDRLEVGGAAVRELERPDRADAEGRPLLLARPHARRQMAVALVVAGRLGEVDQP